MTPRERAIELIETIDNAGWGCLPFEAIPIIKQAIAAAIEEDRKTRECCKQEREVCVGIIEEEATLCRPSNEPRNIKSGYIALHDAWVRIRARSESEKGE